MNHLVNFEKLNIDSWLYKEIVSANVKTLRNSLGVVLINYEMNRDSLKNIPYRRYFDMALVAVWKSSEGFGSDKVILSRSICKLWEISSDDELIDMALKYAPDAYGFWFLPISEYLGMSGVDCQDDISLDMYILTNRALDYGASAVCYSGMLDFISKELGCGYYIFPANIHHMLVVPETVSFIEREAYRRGIIDVNDFTLPIGEFLSNRTYYYDKDTEELIMDDAL